MQIHKLLNPFCLDHHGHQSLRSPAPVSYNHPKGQSVVPKRQKIPKDAPIFAEGNKIVGYMNFPPHEAGNDRGLLDQHRKLHVYPLGEIYQKGIRHIPYISDKKDFQEKTGREAFESKSCLIAYTAGAGLTERQCSSTLI